MRFSVPLVAIVLSTVCPSVQAQEQPKIDGYITRVASQEDFDVNGIRVICRPETSTMTIKTSHTGLLNKGCPVDPVFVGQQAKIYGSKDKKSHAINAIRIEFQPQQAYSVDGTSVIEAILPAVTAPGELLIRADGYRIRINAKTDVSWHAPLSAIGDIKAGDWIEFKGKQGTNGEVTASSASIARDVVTKREQVLRTENDYFPDEVKDSAKEYKLEKIFYGIDPRRLPPYRDRAMQVRVERIAIKLIPQFQIDLPDSDPRKVHFRFQLINTTWFRCALALPSGVILIPHQVVEFMQNDSQLAAVLADAIAAVVDKEEYRLQRSKQTAAAMILGGLLVPYGVPVLQIGGMLICQQSLAEAQRQTQRVSLGLMHDAGYDIDESPRAWWLLSSRNSQPQPISKIAFPNSVGYRYRMLGEVWHNVDNSGAHNLRDSSRHLPLGEYVQARSGNIRR
jgi:hypothetical protein